MTAGCAEKRVVILLSTFNGERFLAEQLDSIAAQTHGEWVILGRDDGSSDRTRSLLDDFARRAGSDRLLALRAPAGRVGVTPSYLSLLRTAIARDSFAFAFADQDDVWLPDKLARGVNALATVAAEQPALYFARQILVDARGSTLGVSQRMRRTPCLLAALTQNVATGCTVMMNRAAACLVARSRAPVATLHDWWSYLLVAGASGRVITDDTPSVLYRQHPHNIVGAPRSAWLRAWAALRRGPDAFMDLLRQHVAALLDQSELLSASARAELAAIAAALEQGRLARAVALRRYGLARQTWPENLLFRLWFIAG